MKFQDEIKPDKTNLNEEWVKQPNFLHKYSVLKDDAKFKEDKSKEKLTLVYAELDLDIRKNFKVKYNLEKVSEAAIKATILTCPEHKTASEEHLKLKHETEIFKSNLEAIHEKHDALQDLTKIWVVTNNLTNKDLS